MGQTNNTAERELRRKVIPRYIRQGLRTADGMGDIRHHNDVYRDLAYEWVGCDRKAAGSACGGLTCYLSPAHRFSDTAWQNTASKTQPVLFFYANDSSTSFAWPAGFTL